MYSRIFNCSLLFYESFSKNHPRICYSLYNIKIQENFQNNDNNDKNIIELFHKYDEKPLYLLNDDII